jgi:protein TonB
MHMINRNYMKLYPRVASVILHVVVLLVFVVSVDFSPQKIQLGESEAQVLNSYVYPGRSTLPSQSAENHSKSAPDATKLVQRDVSAKGLLKKARAENSTAVVSPSAGKSALSSKQQTEASSGEKTSELIALLHTAIQQQQRYPPSAQQLEREGRVTVMFTLYANGTISHLQVVQSSGTDSLDAAAIAAVHDAVPFTQVDQYLHEPQVYRIDVAFELT